MAPKMEGNQNTDGMREALSGLIIRALKKFTRLLRVLSHTRSGPEGTPAHCDASRISAGVLFKESAPAGSRLDTYNQDLLPT